MNYCFNCGAELIEPNQNFCIKCGIDLREYNQRREKFNKDSRKKYEPLEGESYNDYLERINSPLNDKIATDEEIEKEKEDYINYDPLKTYKENNPQINYPKSEREDDDQYEQISDADEEIARKEVIVDGMFGKPMASTEGNFIVEGMYGRPKYYINGDIIRENNQFGRPAYRIDGNYIREGMYGRPKYYIDGDLIKENNQFGRVVGRRKKY